MKSRKNVILSIALLCGILILINILSERFFLRLDFTEDSRYTLSDATKDILQSLNDPVTITAYFSEELPPNIARVEDDFKDLLTEYRSVSGGQVVYKFINPNEDEATEQEALQTGIAPAVIDVREKDQIQQIKAYLGAVIEFNEQKDVIPLIQPGAAMEYALSSGIKKLAILDKPTVGFLQGHGEPALSAMQQAFISLSVLYAVEGVTLDTAGVPERIKTMAIVGPTDTIPPHHLARLDEFLARGGNLVIAYNRVNGDLNNASGSTLHTGLEDWLSQKGITIEDNFVVDANCGSVAVQRQGGPGGFMGFRQMIRFPYLPIITNFADHPITSGIEAVLMRFASSISVDPNSGLQSTPIVMSSEKSGTQSPPLIFDINRQWGETDFPLSNLAVGVVVSGNLAGGAESKMVIIGDGDFPVNGEGQQAQQLQPDNVNLLVNSIDWLSDDTGLIELRTRGVVYRPLDQIEDGTKAILKYGNFLLPILAIVGYGFYRSQRNRRIQLKRKEVDYV